MDFLKAVGYMALICGLVYISYLCHKLDKEWTARVVIEQMKKEKAEK